MSDKIYTVEYEIDGCRHASSYRHRSLEEAKKYAKAGTRVGLPRRYIVVEWTRGEEREVAETQPVAEPDSREAAGPPGEGEARGPHSAQLS